MPPPNKKNAQKSIRSQLTQEERFALADLKQAQKQLKQDERKARQQAAKDKFLARRKTQVDQQLAGEQQGSPAPKQEGPVQAAPQEDKATSAPIYVGSDDDDVRIVAVSRPVKQEEDPDLISTESEPERD